MRIFVCVLLLQLSFVATAWENIKFYLINYSDRECILTNQVRNAYLLNTKIGEKDKQTFIIQPKERFGGYIRFIDDQQLQEDDMLLIQNGNDIFEWHLDVKSYDACFGVAYYIKPSIWYRGENGLNEAVLFTNYKGVELSPFKYRYISQGNGYRVTQMESQDVRFLLMNNNDKGLEGDPEAPSVNDDEEQVRYEREFGDMYSKMLKHRQILEWSDPVLPTTDPGLPEQESNCCVIL